MLNLSGQCEAFSFEIFRCGHCNRDFRAQIMTWVDVSRAPRIKRSLLTWEFNILQCPHCGCRHFSGSPFFYEDFEAGLLVAVFPRIPEKRGVVEKDIREKYGYYPVLEFFYDMTQVWMLIYLEEHYKTNKNFTGLSKVGGSEEKLRTILRFLKEDNLMIDIREKLTESFFGDTSDDDLKELLGHAVYRLEGMYAWPMDFRCMCGADLAAEFKCCQQLVALDNHRKFLSREYLVYCPICKEALSGASCCVCGKGYTWKLGTVDSYAVNAAGRKSRADGKPQLEKK